MTIVDFFKKTGHFIDSQITKLKIHFFEKEVYFDGVSEKYYFVGNHKSDVLLVSFPACFPNSSNYNYIRTLKPFHSDKLFLLDDYASNHQGCYLVESRVEKLVIDIISCILNSCRCRRGGV